MAEIVSGLFGLDPMQVRQQEQQKRQLFANQLAQTYVDPYEQANALRGGLVGNAIGSFLGGVFGLESPELKRATTLENILQQTQQEVGSTDPTVLYPALQKRLAEGGFGREALSVGQLAEQAIQSSTLNKAKLATEQAQLTKAQQERLPEVVRLKQAYDAAVAAGDVETANVIGAQIQKNVNIPEKNMSPENRAETVKLAQFVKQFGEDEGSTKFLEWKNELEQKKSAVQGTGTVLSAVGKPIGNYDDKGTFTSKSGEVIPKEQMVDFRNSQDAASNLLSIMTNITPSDISNAFGKPNVTGGGVASALTRFAANPEVTSAQTKINSLGVKEVLTNLQQLKGASSDKEMARVASTFPGFEAPPEVMEQWLARAVLTTTKFLNKNKTKYGFDAPTVNLEELANIPVVKSIPATERAKFIEGLAKYDEGFKALPESEQIKVLNSIVSGGRLDKPTSKQPASRTTKSGVKYTVEE